MVWLKRSEKKGESLICQSESIGHMSFSWLAMLCGLCQTESPRLAVAVISLWPWQATREEVSQRIEVGCLLGQHRPVCLDTKQIILFTAPSFHKHALTPEPSVLLVKIWHIMDNHIQSRWSSWTMTKELLWWHQKGWNEKNGHWAG